MVRRRNSQHFNSDCRYFCRRLMARLLLLYFLVASTFTSIGQGMLLYLQGNELVSFDPTTCEYSIINRFPHSYTDIALHPNGNLYGIRSSGSIFEMNQATGTSTFIYELNRQPGTIYTAMASSVNGNLYIGEQDGDLVTYNPTTGSELYIGNIEFEIEGDLSFRKGVLYAGSTENIIEINLAEPGASIALPWFIAEKPIWAINTEYVNCDVQLTHALTGQSRPSILYSLDLEAETSSEICRINEVVFGSTSEDELRASSAIDVELTVNQPDCNQTGSVDIHIIDGEGLLFSLNGESPISNPSYTNLPPDNYTLVVTDVNDCAQEFEFAIETYIPIDVTPQITNATCTDRGSIEVIVNGGQNLQFSLNGAAATDNPVFTDLIPGDYTLLAIDDRDCDYSETITIINEDIDFDVEFEVFNATCTSAGSIEISILSGDNLQFQIDDLQPVTSQAIDGISSGDHTLQVSDENGCPLEFEFTIEDNCDLQEVILVPLSFAPNGNGNNEFFKVLTPENITVEVLEYAIYNRWGNLIYSAFNFSSSNSSNYWNGSYQNGEAHSGQFLYHIVYENNNEQAELSGISYLLR